MTYSSKAPTSPTNAVLTLARKLFRFASKPAVEDSSSEAYMALKAFFSSPDDVKVCHIIMWNLAATYLNGRTVAAQGEAVARAAAQAGTFQDGTAVAVDGAVDAATVWQLVEPDVAAHRIPEAHAMIA